MPAAGPGISAEDITAVLGAAHPAASGPRRRLSGFVVSAERDVVRVSCRVYDAPAGVLTGRVMSQVFRGYARTLAAAGYRTKP